MTWLFRVVPRFGFLLPLLAGIAIVLFPLWWGNVTWMRQIMLVCLLALTVSGLNLSFGYGGELAFGQVAYYAVGAYVAGYLGISGHPDILVSVLAAAGAAAAVGLISGIPGLRLGAWSLAMVSFFLVLLIPRFVAILPSFSGGLEGMSGIPIPTLLGAKMSPRGYYYLVTAVTLLWFVFMRNLVSSRHGVALSAARTSPVLATSVGIPQVRTKLYLYVVGAIPAGIAGALFAYLDNFVAPEAFNFNAAVLILAASILGGSVSVYGALAGAAIMQFGPLKAEAFQDYSLVAYGSFLVLCGVLFPGGIAQLVRRSYAALERRYQGVPGDNVEVAGRDGNTDRGADDPILPLEGKLLAVSGISKRFGGVQALDGVDLTAQPGKITAIIGPNGSGKTTLLNVISGFVVPDAGTFLLGGGVLPRGRPDRTALAGVSRTFQTPQLPEDATTLECVALARYRRERTGIFSTVLRLPRYRRIRLTDMAIAWAALRQLGLVSQAHRVASELPLGMQRLIEVARVLASGPGVVLLDEPAAGLDDRDLGKLAVQLRGARTAGATVLLVEHNVPFVLDLADFVYVLHNGSVLCAGTPQEVAANEAVLEVYLGRRNAGVPKPSPATGEIAP
jgi:branched-chain amino acid transport system permease protein